MPQIAIRVHPFSPAEPWKPEVSFYHPDTYIAPLSANLGFSRLQILLRQNCLRVAVPARKRKDAREPLATQHPATKFTSFPTAHTGSLLFPSLLNHTREKLFLHIWNLKRIILDHEDELEKLQRFVDEDRDMLRWNSSNLRYQYASLKFLNQQLRDRDKDVERLREDYAALEGRYDEHAETIEVFEEEEGTLLALQEELMGLREENRGLREEVEKLTGISMGKEVKSREGPKREGLESLSPCWSNLQQPGTAKGEKGQEVEDADVGSEILDVMLEFPGLGQVTTSQTARTDIPDHTAEVQVEQPVSNASQCTPQKSNSTAYRLSVAIPRRRPPSRDRPAAL